MTSPPATGAPLPHDELARLQSLSSYALLDTIAEPEYDELTALAAQICETPMAAITVLDIGRQWVKSAVGLDAAETRRDVSFCAWALLDRHHPLVVPDARQDPRFAGNPLVTGEGGLRSYAGTPLVTWDDQAVGALCVLDTRPRTLSAGQIGALVTLGRQVVVHLELRRALLGPDLARTRGQGRPAEGPRGPVGG